MHTVAIALNRHWYSVFWIKQFYQLWRLGEIKLRPLLTKRNPPYSFYFEVDGKPCLIDVGDHKKLLYNPADYTVYFKANYSPQEQYPANVFKCINGSTLTKANKPPGLVEPKEFDLVWLTGISGGRLHKFAMFEALSALPLRMKLAAKMVTPQDYKQWGKRLENLGVEVWKRNLPYRQWLEWNKKARWCMLSRGKHDCLSFKMVDYCSIAAAVVVDYPPTSVWAVPLHKDTNYISFDFSGPQTNDLSEQEFMALRKEYAQKANQLLGKLQDDTVREKIASANYKYYVDYIEDGTSARSVVNVINTFLSAPIASGGSTTYQANKIFSN